MYFLQSVLINSLSQENGQLGNTTSLKKWLQTLLFFYDNQPDILPSSYDFMIHGFNKKLKTILDTVAPIKQKTVNTNRTTPWRNKETPQLKRENAE